VHAAVYFGWIQILRPIQWSGSVDTLAAAQLCTPRTTDNAMSTTDKPLIITLDLSGADDYAILVHAMQPATAHADDLADREADVNQRQYFLDQAAAANTLLERIRSAVDRFYNGAGMDPRPT
jgi:hypothetical protein